MAWAKRVLTLKHYGEQIKRAPREGYVREDGLIALPPKNAKRVSAWLKKMAERKDW